MCVHRTRGLGLGAALGWAGRILYLRRSRLEGVGRFVLRTILEGRWSKWIGDLGGELYLEQAGRGGGGFVLRAIREAPKPTKTPRNES